MEPVPTREGLSSRGVPSRASVKTLEEDPLAPRLMYDNAGLLLPGTVVCSRSDIVRNLQRGRCFIDKREG